MLVVCWLVGWLVAPHVCVCLCVYVAASAMQSASLPSKEKKSTNYSDAYDTLLSIILTIVCYLFMLKIPSFLPLRRHSISISIPCRILIRAFQKVFVLVDNAHFALYYFYLMFGNGIRMPCSMKKD